MRATTTVTGPDRVGIFAAVTSEPTGPGAHILDVSRTLMDEYSTAIPLCDLGGSAHSTQQVREAVPRERLSIRLRSEETFTAMHTI